MEFLRKAFLSVIFLILSVSVIAGVSASPAVRAVAAGACADPDSLVIAEADSLFSSIELDEVVVTAQVKPIVVRGDTTVINASSFGVDKNDDLEELVRRIPGMEYDKESKTLKYNGQVIHEIVVNGQKFLESNICEGLRILSAGLVDKIKVYDKRDEEETLMNIRRTTKHLVLDLQTSREFNGVMSLSAVAAWGDQDKKQFGLGAQRFDMGGDNFMVDVNTGNQNIDTRYKGNRRDGASLNISKKITEKFNLYGSFLYTRSKEGNDFATYNERYLQTATDYQYLRSDMVSKMKSLMGNVGFRWNVDKNTIISLNSSFNGSDRQNGQQSRQATFDSYQGLNVRNPFEGDAFEKTDPAARINATENVTHSDGSNRNLRVGLDITRKLNEKGSALNFSADISAGNSDNRNFTVSQTHYYRIRNWLGGDSILYRNQYTNGPTRNFSHSYGLTFSQPLVRNLVVDLSYKFGLSRDRSRHAAYDLSPFFDDAPDTPVTSLPPGYENEYIDSLSNHTVGNTVSHQGEIGLNYYGEKLSVVARCIVRPQRQTLDQKTGLMQADTVRNSVNFNPSFMASWRNSKVDLTLNYSGQTSQPELSSLLSLTDNSNPLYITHGNPNLKASYSHTLSFRASSLENGLAADGSLTGVYNSQTYATFYNMETGGSETYPVNVSGDRNANASISYFKFTDGWLFSGSMSGQWARNVGLVNENQSEQPQRSITNTTGYNADFQVRKHGRWGYAEFSGRWFFNRSFNRLRDARLYTRNYVGGLSWSINIPGNIEFNNDLNFTYRNGTNVNSREDSQVLWNMELQWSFLKNKEATVAVKWYDILSDTKNISRNSSATAFTESFRRQIGSYFLVSFRYRLRKEL